MKVDQITSKRHIAIRLGSGGLPIIAFLLHSPRQRQGHWEPTGSYFQ